MENAHVSLEITVYCDNNSVIFKFAAIQISRLLKVTQLHSFTVNRNHTIHMYSGITSGRVLDEVCFFFVLIEII